MQGFSSSFDIESSPERRPWCPSLSPGIAVQVVDDEAILLDKRNQRVHHLDPVGAKILAFCDGRSSVDEIVKCLLGEFEVGEKELTDDVEQFFSKMRMLEILN